MTFLPLGVNFPRLPRFAASLVLAIWPAASFAAEAAATPERTGAPHRFEIGADAFLLDGQPFQIRCGELHAPRVPREYWRHRLQMVKAMGLNTVCAYLFWNMHEPRPGEFDWSGQADAAAFCREAQAAGLWVILRPGPYACAEWEMGGLPWWLLKHDEIKLRTRDPRFIEAARRYLQEVGRELGPLQVSRGGPILMVQVENEHGFYADDPAYMGDIRQALLDAGFDVPLFACNPTQQVRRGYRPDLFPVVNFGTDPAGGFRALREILPTGPLMCGEFYPGWFDTWGAPHHTGQTERYLTDLDYMLRTGASFSIYMAHGGTTFGFWTGADRPFKPDTSSYDYDAPISEAGWATPKFEQSRALLSKYLLPEETLPEPAPRHRVITLPPTPAEQVAAIWSNLPAPITDESPRTMELYDQGFGCIVYRTQLPAGPAAILEAAAIHDIGQVFLDGQRIGFTDRRSRHYRVPLPERTTPATLDILVEAMGRVNFGVEVHDRKGIHGPVTLTASGQPRRELRGWQIFRLPLDQPMLGTLRYQPTGEQERTSPAPAFWRATVKVEQPGDCFLDMRPWGKGFVWVNGHNLGRYWNIGPQQTMYVPAPWLKAGDNEIVVLDLIGPANPVIAALDQPILDQLRPKLDFAPSRRRQVTLRADFGTPAHRGSFDASPALQEVSFSHAVRGRYFCLEALNAQDGGPLASVAEIALLDDSGHPLSAEAWTIAYVDSEEREQGDGTAENAIDGQTANAWRTQWGTAQPGYPHRLIVDLAEPRTVGGFRYVPRQGPPDTTGRIKDYRVFVADDLITP
ncbi:beta-galactosidase [Opitutus terrae]|uniref:Beta-galactosidase n=1 Tax=Opitutus terrae (strain DSM 11246 / JCM 15787 / PB90-1) TaxID=452637 RepID=B1ZY57_OPITP|nr:beta-galactosidase [Opitutus terrae]ACB76206.1 Beta-galactosidase [Opitutus terrae PB90-1]